MARSLQALSSNSEMRPVFHDCKQMIEAIVDRVSRGQEVETPAVAPRRWEDGE